MCSGMAEQRSEEPAGTGVTIRAITLGLGAAHPLDVGMLTRAADILQRTQRMAEAAGYSVQTTRIATHPLLEEMADAAEDALLTYAADLQTICERAGIGYLSLGPAPADDPAFSLALLARIPRLIAPYATLNAAVQLASEAHGVRYDATLAVAQVMRELAERSAGEANFRFAALACCAPGGPFFPQAYARGDVWTLSVGLQSADLVGRAIASVVTADGVARASDDEAEIGAPLARLPRIGAAITQALTEAAAPVVALIQAAARETGCAFGGIDLSPAPMGGESIVRALEAAGLGRFGGAGSLALTATLTAAIKAVALPTCGYCGLMLPVLEDELLGQRCAEGALDVPMLLQLSAVCGTGLDTIPLPGETPPARIAALLADVATLAWRLRKPLSARLFLTPGGHAGEPTAFTSPYLTNTRILPLE